MPHTRHSIHPRTPGNHAWRLSSSRFATEELPPATSIANRAYVGAAVLPLDIELPA